jgi:hypothetical protein
MRSMKLERGRTKAEIGRNISSAIAKLTERSLIGQSSTWLFTRSSTTSLPLVSQLSPPADPLVEVLTE